MRVLNVGCGMAKLDFQEALTSTQVIGVDLSRHSQADVIHDLNQIPWPFETGAFDLVIMQDIIEHLIDVPAAINEVYRILRHGGRVRIRTPHYSSSYAYNDPTHVHFFGTMVFDGFTDGNTNRTYSTSRFRMRVRRIIFPKVWRITGVAWLANRFVHRWEQLFAFVFRAENLYFEMEAVKEDASRDSHQTDS